MANRQKPDMEAKRKQVIGMLNACLLSSKGGVPVGLINRDYLSLVGEPIAYRDLGFNSLEAFLRSVPNIAVTRNRDGEVMVEALPDKSTEHLANLISKQKTAGRKTRGGSRGGAARRPHSSWSRPPPSRSRNFEKPRQLSQRNAHDPPKPTKYRNTVPNNADVSPRPFEVPPRFLKHIQKTVSQSNDAKLVHRTTTVLAPGKGSGIHRGPTIEYNPKTVEEPRKVVQSTQKSVERPQKTVEAPKPTDVSCRTVEYSPRRPLKCSIDISKANITRTVYFENNNSQSLNEMLFQSKSPIQDFSPQLSPVDFPISEQPHIYPTDADYKAALDNFVEKKGLDKAVFKTIIRKPKKGPSVYVTSVKAGDGSYSSYPHETPNPDEAIQLAAKAALEGLINMYGDLGENYAETKDAKLIVERVVQVLEGRPNGLWATQVPLDYKNSYHEKLPDDWLDLLKGHPLINIDRVADNRYILYPENGRQENRKSPPPAPFVFPSANSTQEQSAQPLSPVPDDSCMPRSLQLPEDQYWDIFVTTAPSTCSVWIRLIGDLFSEEYENMVTDMEIYYMTHNLPVENPQAGMFCAVKFDESWHRVEILEIEDGHARCFYVDHGDEETFSLQDLQMLEKRFVGLPCQALQCYLTGLEEYSDNACAASHLIQTIVGRTLVADVVVQDDGVGLVLYDTSGDEDMNLNAILLEKISQDVMSPQLPEVGEVKEVFVSHFTDDGDIYVQMQADSQATLGNLLEQITEQINEGQIPEGVKDVDSSVLHLAQYHLDGNWYRAAIKGTPDTLQRVEVYFVDFGNTQLTTLTKLIALDCPKALLTRMPYQAIHCKLHNIPPSNDLMFCDKTLKRLKELVGEEDPVLLKVILAATDTEPASVELFRRIQPANFLVSVNSTVAYEKDLFKPVTLPRPTSAGDSRKKLERAHSLGGMPSTDSGVFSRSSSRSSSTMEPNIPYGNTASLRGLSPPQIPEIGCYFDVYVTMAANPGNFTVQPYSDRFKLNEMMKEMQGYYEISNNPQTKDKLKEGGLYAAYHSDGKWYRICLTNVMDNAASVYFLDFGDICVLSLDKLQPLATHFYQLPYQAIKAKLVGIVPKHSDWSVEDCLRFQELVVDRAFVSTVHETGPDLINPNDTVVGLKLIDTSDPDKDLFVHKLLVEEGRAVFT